MSTGGGAIVIAMTSHPNKERYGTSLQGVGGAKTMNLTPTNKAVNSCFTRGGWAKTMNPHPHKQGSELLLY